MPAKSPNVFFEAVTLVNLEWVLILAADETRKSAIIGNPAGSAAYLWCDKSLGAAAGIPIAGTSGRLELSRELFGDLVTGEWYARPSAGIATTLHIAQDLGR